MDVVRELARYCIASFNIGLSELIIHTEGFEYQPFRVTDRALKEKIQKGYGGWMPELYPKSRIFPVWKDCKSILSQQ